jgi:hypothetical protein
LICYKILIINRLLMFPGFPMGLPRAFRIAVFDTNGTVGQVFEGLLGSRDNARP